MPKFSFKLQSILKIKKQMEDSIKNDLGKALKKLEDEKLALNNLLEKEEACINTLCEKSGKLISIKDLKDYNDYISYLGDVITIQKENVNLAEYNVDKVRDELLVVVKERKMLEKLKGKKLDEYKVQLLIDEQKMNDEIVSFKRNSALID